MENSITIQIESRVRGLWLARVAGVIIRCVGYVLPWKATVWLANLALSFIRVDWRVEGGTWRPLGAEFHLEWTAEMVPPC